MYLLDTNIVSERLRKFPHPEVQRRIEETPLGQRYLSVVTYRELRCGAALRDDSEKFWRTIEIRCLALGEALSFEPRDALRAGDLSAQLRRIGCGISENDLLLAAHALSRNLLLVTRNVRHFERVPGLRFENWFQTKKE